MKNFLIDIDGTICDDIRNEDSHLYPNANPFKDAAHFINKLYDSGNKITFFTAREIKDYEVTINWLDKHEFKYHNLIMGKPRGGNYIWIDNHKPEGILFSGDTWTEEYHKKLEALCGGN